MNYPETGAGRWTGNPVLLCSLALLPAMAGAYAVAMMPVPGPSAWWWLLPALVAPAAAVAWRSSGTRTLRDRLERLEMPAAASTVGGRLICVNAAMYAACGATGSDLARTLSRGFDVGAPTVYRLTTAARRLGFGFEETRRLADGAPVFLAARLAEPHTVVWTAIPPEKIPSMARNDETTAGNAAPFHLRQTDESPGARAALDAMPVALMQFDLSGRLLWSNAHAREIVGGEIQPGIALSDLVEPLGRPVDVLLSDTAAPPRAGARWCACARARTTPSCTSR